MLTSLLLCFLQDVNDVAASGLPLPEETESARARRARLQDEQREANGLAKEASSTSSDPCYLEPQKVVGERFDALTRQRHLQVRSLELGV